MGGVGKPSAACPTAYEPPKAARARAVGLYRGAETNGIAALRDGADAIARSVGRLAIVLPEDERTERHDTAQRLDADINAVAAAGRPGTAAPDRRAGAWSRPCRGGIQPAPRTARPNCHGNTGLIGARQNAPCADQGAAGSALDADRPPELARLPSAKDHASTSRLVNAATASCQRPGPMRARAGDVELWGWGSPHRPVPPEPAMRNLHPGSAPSGRHRRSATNWQPRKPIIRSIPTDQLNTPAGDLHLPGRSAAPSP